MRRTFRRIYFKCVFVLDEPHGEYMFAKRCYSLRQKKEEKTRGRVMRFKERRMRDICYGSLATHVARAQNDFKMRPGKAGSMERGPRMCPNLWYEFYSIPRWDTHIARGVQSDITVAQNVAFICAPPSGQFTIPPRIAEIKKETKAREIKGRTSI